MLLHAIIDNTGDFSVRNRSSTTFTSGHSLSLTRAESMANVGVDIDSLIHDIGLLIFRRPISVTAARYLSIKTNTIVI